VVKIQSARTPVVARCKLTGVFNPLCLNFKRGERGEITMNQLGKVRRLYSRDGHSISEVSRRSGLSRNTAKRWLREAEGAEPQYRRQSVSAKLAPYAERLKAMLEQGTDRPKRERRTAKRLYEDIRAEGFEGDYRWVTEYVRLTPMRGRLRRWAVSRVAAFTTI
jgi:transposase